MKLTAKKEKKEKTKKEGQFKKTKALISKEILEIPLKDLEWQVTSTGQALYSNIRTEQNGVRIRVQIFLKDV